MKVEETSLSEVLLIHPDKFIDERGYFMESWNKQQYADYGILSDFVQDNVSFSTKDTLRGLHFQKPNPQAKLVYPLSGEIYDVVVDLRVDSAAFGHWVGIRLSSEKPRQLYIPAGFAHGFCVLSASALVQYKCSDFYNPAAEYSLRWDDSDLGIDWPVRDPTVSAKDQAGFFLKDLPKESLYEVKLATDGELSE